MPSLDNSYRPFDDYLGWSSMAPCMRSCDHDLYFNGCDIAACWCNKGNLDLRIASATKCATSSCTFANMNTATDIAILSGIQVQYCVDKNHSPAGMALPSSVDAVPTETSDPFATTTAAATGTRSKSVTGPTGTKDIVTSLSVSAPTSMPPNSLSLPTNTPSGNTDLGSTALSTAAKTGIGIGVSACALLAILIVLLLLRRRKPAPVYYPPPPSYGVAPPPPNMVPTPYSGNGPFSPPPLQQPVPVHAAEQGYAGNMGDVSPVEEKAVPVSTSGPKVLRKEVGGMKNRSDVEVNETTPGPLPTSTHDLNIYPQASGGPQEIHGSVPPQRHEVGNEGQITNTVSTKGMELDSTQQPVAQYPGQPQYQQSAQGYPYYAQGGAGAHEVDGGQQWVQRQELSGQGQGQQQGQWAPQGGYAPYEMPGR